MAKAPILTPQAEDFPRWYQDVVAKAELADNGPVRGTMVIRPYGYAIWERMQAEVDLRIKAAGADNCYFPLFIPESYLRREAEHVEGFAPSSPSSPTPAARSSRSPSSSGPPARPSSTRTSPSGSRATATCPCCLNQWANVVRWELRPRLFLRTTEFLWQEGHTAHATQDDARAYAERILYDVYADFMVNVLAIPVLTGRKTANERFPGAINTARLRGDDGRRQGPADGHQPRARPELRQGLRHPVLLGDRQPGVRAGRRRGACRTRMVGGLIMAHGDDSGLRLPPRLAPIQVVVLLVHDEDGAGEAAERLAAELRAAGVRVQLDAATDAELRAAGDRLGAQGRAGAHRGGPRDLAQGT